MDYKNDSMQAAAAQDYMEVQTGAAAAQQVSTQASAAAQQAQAQPGAGAQQQTVQPVYTSETAYQPQGTYSDYDPSLEMFYEEQNASAKTYGAVGLGLGIGGFLTGWFGLGLILDLVAIALGAISINKNRFKKGLGIAAISVASVGFLLTMLLFGFSYSKWKENIEEFNDIVAGTDYDYDYTYDYDDDTASDTKSLTDTAKLKEKEHYKVGDTVKVETDNGEYSFTIKGVSETAERNEYADTDPDRVILVDYEYENISYAVEFGDYFNDKLYLGTGDFEFYDAEGRSIDDYPISYAYPHSISPGHKTSGQMALGLNSDSNYIEIELDDYGYKGPGIVVDLDW